MVPKNAPPSRRKAAAVWPARGLFHGDLQANSAAPLEASILGDAHASAAVRVATRASKVEGHTHLPVLRLHVMAGARSRGAAPFSPRCRIRPLFSNAVAY